jgi:nitrate/TMAO reductase-like tetraheme cytochrome c subunit
VNTTTDSFTDSRETSVTDSTVEPIVYESAEMCGECHTRQYEEWRTSMHAYAARSPVFDALAQKSFRDTSGEIGTFCTGCHSPFGTEEGEPGSTVAADRSSLSLEGVSCDYCHSAVTHSGTVGNNNLVIDDYSGAQGPYSADSNDSHLSEESEFIQSPEFCGSCHDVFNFPGIRLEEAYTEYLVSPSAEEGVRCQDCHMGVTPGEAGQRPWGPSAAGATGDYPDREQASHYFTGPDYSLIDAFPYPDDLEASAAEQEASLQRSLTLLKNGAKISALDIRQDPEHLRVNVAVVSLVGGHSVPTGFSSERQMWIELVVSNSAGDIVFESGTLDENGDLRDSHSAMVQAGTATLDEQLVNFQSRNLIRHGVQDELEIEETMFPTDANYIERLGLRPYEERIISYTFHTEPDESLSISVRLRFRNLPPYLLRALQAESLVERLHIFDIDSKNASWQ